MSKCELGQRNLIRKSIFVKYPLPKGHILKVEDLALKRPVCGIEPAHLELVIGRRLKRNFIADEPLFWKDV